MLFIKERDINGLVRTFKDNCVDLNDEKATQIFQEISKDGFEIRSQDLVEFVHWRFRHKFGKQTGYQVIRLISPSKSDSVGLEDFKTFLGLNHHQQ